MTKCTVLGRGALCAAPMVLLLTACGGTTIGADTGVLATGAPLTEASFNGVTFPLYAVGLDRSGAGPIGFDRFEGEVEVVDEDTLRLRLPGQPEKTLRRAGGFSDWTDAAAVSYWGEVLGAAAGSGVGGRGLTREFSEIGPDESGFHGSYGFETPASALSGAARFGSGSYTLALALDGVADQIVFGGGGGADLTVDFDGGGIAGRLGFQYSTEDVDGDAQRDDVIELVVDVDGRIAGGVYTGAVTASATARIDGGPTTTPIGVTLSDTEMAWHLFGNNADSLSSEFLGDVSLDVPINGGTEGRFAGWFFAGR